MHTNLEGQDVDTLRRIETQKQHLMNTGAMAAANDQIPVSTLQPNEVVEITNDNGSNT